MMARITVEDCIDKVPNRYELMLLAVYRARLIAHGSPATVDIDRDKAAIVALREIGHGTISADDLREALIHSLKHNVEVDEPDASAAPLLESQNQPRSEGVPSLDELTAEQLLEPMQKLLPLDPSAPEEERASGSDSKSDLDAPKEK